MGRGVGVSVLNNEEPVGTLVGLLNISLVKSPELPASVVGREELLSVWLVMVPSVSGETDVGFSVLLRDEAAVTPVVEDSADSDV